MPLPFFLGVPSMLAGLGFGTPSFVSASSRMQGLARDSQIPSPARNVAFPVLKKAPDKWGFYFLNSFFARSNSVQTQLIVSRASLAFPLRQ
jgi:hypothetical protein